MSGPLRPRPWLAAGCWLTLLALVALQLRLLTGFGVRTTTDDQALLWLAGQDLSVGQLHQPNFYGQTYNTVFEVLPGVLLHALGWAWPTAITAGCTLLATALLAAPALVAWRAGRPRAALCGLLLPLVLSTPYLLLADAPRGVLSGTALATAALCVAVSRRRSAAAVAVTTAAGLLACLWDNGAALLALPAIVIVLVETRRRDRQAPVWSAAVVGAVPAVLWLTATQAFYAGHPQDVRANGVALDPSAARLLLGLTHPDRYLGFFAPFGRGGALVPVLALVGLLAVALLRSGATRWAALVLVGLLLAVLASAKGQDVHPGVYLSGARMVLDLPEALWLIAALTPWHRPARTLPRWTLARWTLARWTLPRVPLATVGGLVLGAVVVLTVGCALGRLPSVAGTARLAIGPDVLQGFVHPTAVDLVTTGCRSLDRLAAPAGSTVVVTSERLAAYACPALHPGLQTVYPPYERRGWVVRDLSRHPATRVLLEAQVTAACRASAAGCHSDTDQGLWTAGDGVTPGMPAGAAAR